MNDKSVCFDVKVYLTKEEWDNKTQSEEIAAFDEIEDAIEEAELWPEAYQTIVVARTGNNTYEAGEYVFALNLLPG